MEPAGASAAFIHRLFIYINNNTDKLLGCDSAFLCVLGYNHDEQPEW